MKQRQSNRHPNNQRDKQPIKKTNEDIYTNFLKIYTNLFIYKTCIN